MVQFPHKELELVVELTEQERQVCADYEWVLHDAAVQRMYQGQVIAVHRRRILGVGAEHREALQAALRLPDCPARAVIALVFVDGSALNGPSPNALQDTAVAAGTGREAE